MYAETPGTAVSDSNTHFLLHRIKNHFLCSADLRLVVVVDRDACLDVYDGGEVAPGGGVGLQRDVDNLIRLDNHQEGVVALNAGAVVAEAIAWETN